MKKIQILGTGCPSCTRLAALAEEVAREMGIEHEIEKVTDMARIVGFGIMATPGLVVDGTVRESGRVPSRDEMKKYLQ